MRPLLLITAVLVALLPACNRAPQETAQEPTPSPTSTTEPSAVASETKPPTTEPSPTVTQAPPEPSAESPGEGQLVELWFLRTTNRGDYFYMEPELWRLPESTRGVARATMELLVRAEPRSGGLWNNMPDGTKLLGVELEGTTLVVDLDFPNDDPGLGSPYEGNLYAQIVHTGAQFPTVDRVRVLEEGRPPPSGHFDDPGRVQRPKPDRVSPVVVMTPQQDETVDAGEITVGGTANVYEATVLLRLKTDDGAVVDKTFTTATCGTGCRGEWEHTFSITEPGRYTVIAAASDPSDGEGPPPFAVRRTFTVR